MNRQVLKTEQKALEINLNDKIYGTFSEIGAGQEVARNFFQVGAAAGTVAKTMSAYDKTYSDTIYGGKSAGRYVSEKRLNKMLDHEYRLMEERLLNSRTDTCFFAFADTVQAINYSRTVKGNGWMGLRFQCAPNGPFNDFILHVRMLDSNNRQQQEAIGVLGVNLIYAAFMYRGSPEEMVLSLIDGLKSRIKIDMVRISGPDLEKIDNRLLSLYLVKHALSNVAIFDENHKSIHASEFLYKKNLMVVRGNFKPPTVVSVDAFATSFSQFVNEAGSNKENSEFIAEITLENLTRDHELDEKDYLDRANLLCALGKKVMVTNCTNHQGLIDYLRDYKIQRLGLVIGAIELQKLFVKKYKENKNGRLLVAFGELFTQNITVYVYPAKFGSDNALLTLKTMSIPDGIKFLYYHLLEQKQIVDVEGFNQKLLDIIPSEVLVGLRTLGNTAWEKALPPKLVQVIKEKKAFGYQDVNKTNNSQNIETNDARYF
ncbi:MAG: TonB-dependent receptor [Saprospiraceae bacterium]